MTADIAVIVMGVVALASMGRDYRLQMKVADRVRVVSPPRQSKPPADAATVEDLSKRRPA